MRRALVICCAVALVLSALTVFATPPRMSWVKLGARTVTDRVDHDVIAVGPKEGQFRALKITVANRAVEIHEILKGDNRTISRVDFWYDAQSLGGKAKISLFGRR